MHAAAVCSVLCNACTPLPGTLARMLPAAENSTRQHQEHISVVPPPLAAVHSPRTILFDSLNSLWCWCLLSPWETADGALRQSLCLCLCACLHRSHPRRRQPDDGHETTVGLRLQQTLLGIAYLMPRPGNNCPNLLPQLELPIYCKWLSSLFGGATEGYGPLPWFLAAVKSSISHSDWPLNPPVRRLFLCSGWTIRIVAL